MAGKSIFDKLWDRHVITGEEGSPTHVCGPALLFIEVTSPQVFKDARRRSQIETTRLDIWNL